MLETLIMVVCLGDFRALLPNSAAVFQKSKIPESASCLLARLRGTGSLQAQRSETLQKQMYLASRRPRASRISDSQHKNASVRVCVCAGSLCVI